MDSTENGSNRSEDYSKCLQTSKEEDKYVKLFIEQASKLPCGFDFGTDNKATAFRFLAARKFEVNRAIDLYIAHQRLRNSEGLLSVNHLDENVRRELLSGKFTVLNSRDESGAAIALFTARLHWPSATTQRDTLRGLVLQLDAALTSPITQRNGIIFIYDMTGSKYINFDYELSIKILNMLKGTYPARLRKVLIVTAPLWFRAPFQVLRLFVREKLRDRVHTLDLSHLTRHIPLDVLPHQLGGKAAHDHKQWVKSALASLNRSIPDNYMTMALCGSNISGSDSWPKDEKSRRNKSDDAGSRSLNGYSEALPTITHRNSHKRSKAVNDDHSPDNEASVKKRPISSCSPSQTQSMHPESAPCVHTAEQPGFTLQEVEQYVRQVSKRGIIKEYLTEITTVKNDITIEAFKDNTNRPKNRYVDVYCYDDTRVHLINGPDNDYIHANWVDSYRQKRAFICTQGPLPTTTNDFWIMVWDYNVPIIVMTTKTIENRRTKCFQYWPADEGETYAFGTDEQPFEVTNNGWEDAQDFKTTHLILRNCVTDEKRDLYHFYFLTWPDHGIPDCADGFLQYYSAVSDKYMEHAKKLGYNSLMDQKVPPPPMIVHCSAGIGRTGTFITVDICIKRLHDVGTVNIADTVLRLRQQRYGCIQVPMQYVFCYKALLEYAYDKELIHQPAKIDSSSEEDN